MKGGFVFRHGYRQRENRSTHHLGRSVAAMKALCQSHVRSDQTEGLDRSGRRRRANRRTKAPLPKGGIASLHSRVYPRTCLHCV